MSIPNDHSGSLAGSLRDRRRHSETPINKNVQSGIYRAITTGEPDPEGRGRLAAYIPKLGGDPENPLFFQYASPFGGENGGGSYGFFAVPPDAGVTILVFFAENGEMSEGYWFAVTQQVHNVAAGGPAGTARNDGTGQGEGTFSDVPSASTVADDLARSRDPSVVGGYDEAGLGIKRDSSVKGGYDEAGLNLGSTTPSSTEAAWTTADAQEVERLKNFNNELGGGSMRVQLTPGERAYARSRGYLPESNLDAFGGSGQSNPDATDPRGRDQRDVPESTRPQNEEPDDPDADDPRGRDQRGTSGSGSANDPSNTRPNHGRNANTAAQGVYSDPVRGQTSASPTRNASFETPQPSSVYGMRTPGSNSFVMDDGIISDTGEIHPNQIRIQTGSGASVILDGTNDLIYIVNSTGSGWVEIGAKGEIMAYAQGSISMRAEKDFNIRADKNINMEAGEKINMMSGNNFTVNSGNQAHIKSEGSQFFDSGGSNHTKVATNMYLSTGGKLHLNGPQAAMSPGLSTASHCDIQEGSSTVVNDSILSTMPSHEPMMRANPGVAGTVPGGDSAGANGGTQPDPNSVAGQEGAAGTDPGAENTGVSNFDSETYVVGDSHGVGIKAAGGFKGSPVNGASVSAIAGQVASVPEGATVILVAGNNNVGSSPSSVQSGVQGIVDSLKAKDCKVTLVLFPDIELNGPYAATYSAAGYTSNYNAVRSALNSVRVDAKLALTHADINPSDPMKIHATTAAYQRIANGFGGAAGSGGTGEIEVVPQEGDHRLDNRLQPALKRLLIACGNEVGVICQTTSGLRPMTRNRNRQGLFVDTAGSSSGRHTNGYASDTALIRNGRTLDHNNSADQAYIRAFSEAFMRKALAAGFRPSVGWGTSYMSAKAGHFDIAHGQPNPSRPGETIVGSYWGNRSVADGAPAWLSTMYSRIV